VIYAETFLAVSAFVYMSMICIMNTEPLESITPVEVWPHEISHDFVVESFRSLETCDAGDERWQFPERPAVEETKEDECELKRSHRLATLGTSFVVAFMAGGFMNIERVQGLPLP
jgi:hypothetical protein